MMRVKEATMALTVGMGLVFGLVIVGLVAIVQAPEAHERHPLSCICPKHPKRKVWSERRRVRRAA